MAQVPYAPVLSERQSATGLPDIEPSVPNAAFGAEIGAAVSGLGKTVSEVGDDIYKRAEWLQNLNNTAEAKAADANYMIQAGKLNAEYSALEGDNAVKAYPTYIKNLQALRGQIRDGLSTAVAQRQYDGDTLSTMSRSIFSGAGHAARAQKAYVNSAIEAKRSANINFASQDPEDESRFRAGLQENETLTRQQGQINGLPPEAIEEAASVTKSTMWSKRINSLAKEDPLRAGKMLDDATKRGELRGEDIAKVTSVVQQQRNTIGARLVSKQVSEGGLSWGAKPVDIKQAAEAIGTFESGGRYNLVGVETKHGRALGKYQVMEAFLPEFLRDAGMPPMSRDEFLKSPAAQDQLFNTRFGQYMKETGSFNDAASKWFSGKTMAEAGGRKDALGTTVPAYVANVNAILARNAPLSQKVDMGKGLAARIAPDDPLFPDYVEQRIQSDHNRVIAIKKDDEFRNRQVVEEGLMGGSGGTLPTTVEELTDTPEKRQAWQDLLPSTQRRYMGVLARNAKGDTNWTDDSLREYQKLKGQANADPASFLDMDVIGTDLPNSAKRELINLQGRLKGKAEADPRVVRALNILGPDLQAAGIERKNKDEYHQFIGALADQLQQFAEENKRPPKIEEVKLIGSRLLQQQTQKGWLWNSKTPTFQVPVPSDEVEAIKLDPTWTKLGITPTEQQIQRIYTRSLFQKLYGGTTKADAAAPKPPVSE